MPIPTPGPRVALATCARLPELWTDDQVLATELRARHVDIATPVWDDDAIEWSRFDLVVIRSTWDYWLRRDAYLAWARQVAQVSTLLNPAAVVEWNTHKGYLRDLASAGVPVVPTAWLAAGRSADVRAVMAGQGWTDAVVKPAISAGAEDTLRWATSAPEDVQRLVDRVLATRDMMVQPYVDAVETSGERSLLYVDGQLTHGVRRPPYLSAGQYAPSTPAEPAPDEIAVAEKVLAAVPAGTGTLLYARVDLVRDADGRPMLMEVELVEPQMFFEASDAATQRMASAIVARAGNADRSTTTGS